MSGFTQSQRQYLTFSQFFTWDRDFSITWDLTRNLKTSFRSGTIAEREEPYLQVNKKLNRDDYELWKDSVIQSIQNLGKPLNYEQTADISYTLPFAQIPVLDWMSVSTAYNSRYRWERGAFIRDENIGNILQNDLSLTVNGRLNLVQLYNKIGFLRKTGQRFDADVAQYLARSLMMVRSVNVNFGYRSRTDIPGFDPMVGDFFGQSHTPAGLIPGLGFAFGFDGGERFLEKSDANNWLVKNADNISPALYQQTHNVRMEATLEPLRGLKIDLNALYENSRRTEIQYMFDEMPKIYGGSFAISTLTLASAFENSKAGNGYASASFDRFLANREVIAGRVRSRYQNHPSGAAIGDVNPHSADVLIPSFLAAYTGGDAQKIGLTAFPDLLSLLPNWNISYNVLQMLPALQANFKSLTLMHKYVSQYRVGAFSSFLSWIPLDDTSDLGYVRDVLTGSPVPSSPYDISAVNLIEPSARYEARGVTR